MMNMLSRTKLGVKNALMSGKSRHFAFILGAGYGYLQYLFFEDLLNSRAHRFERSARSITKILSEVVSCLLSA